MNVYWEKSRSAWDAHFTPSIGASENQLDSFLSALISSSYFADLSQYGVQPPTMIQSITLGTACGSPPSFLDDDGTYGSIVATCLAYKFLPALLGSSNPSGPVIPQNLVINLFLPPQSADRAACKTDPVTKTHQTGWHGTYWVNQTPSLGQPPPTFLTAFAYLLEIAIIPATQDCNVTLGDFTTTLSHEMVESVTDKTSGNPFGWKNFADGEIADLCENQAQPFFNGMVSAYWSK
jgi:hypothetical protein